MRGKGVEEEGERGREGNESPEDLKRGRTGMNKDWKGRIRGKKEGSGTGEGKVDRRI